MSEAEKRIREALAAGPTPGPWNSELLDQNDFADVHRVFGTDTSHEATLCELWSGEHNNEAAATYIAACNPTNIAALLAEIDRLRARAAAAENERDALWEILRMFLRAGYGNSTDFRLQREAINATWAARRRSETTDTQIEQERSEPAEERA